LDVAESGEASTVRQLHEGGKETKGKERRHQGTEGSSVKQKGAAIEMDRRYISHRKGREEVKFRKNKATKMSTVDRPALLADLKWQGKTAEWKVGLETETSQKWE
jgi:hypothetical protein